MSNFTCKNCPYRAIACHGSCEKYQKEKDNYEKRKKYIKDEQDFENYRILAIRRTKHEKRR